MAKRKKSPDDRHVSIYHWMMRTDAWRSLSCVARAAYVELKGKYAGPGSNNGRLHCSLLEMAKALHISKATAMRAFRELQEKGFIVLMIRGGFKQKTRRASEWRLTETMCDVTGNLPTKEFTRWRRTQK